jgi:hypothetical protein
MDQRDAKDTEYEAPVVEDVETAEGPSSVAAGGQVISVNN